MLRKIILPVIFLILTYGFWISPDFKEIAAGVSIFLFGMLFLEEGFKAFTGGILERILKNTTDTFPKSLMFGVVSTTIMQSSSLVSVITISFLSAGLIGLTAGIGIIFGANLGTTTGAWLVAAFGLKVKISAYAMPMLVFGIILVFQKSKTLKGFGYILAGLGFLFLGIHYMKEGFEAFKDQIDLTSFAMEGYLGLFVFTGIGLLATVVMQSSHATLVLIITALAAAQISYPNALALAIGANVGTTITAVIGALSSNYQGKRLAGAHLIFNVATGLIAIIFINQMIWGVDNISQAVGIAQDDYTLKLAVFHTIFNTVGIVLTAPFVGFMVRFLEKTIPAPSVVTIEPKFLNDATFDFPETMLETLRNEIVYLYDNAFEIITHGINLRGRDVKSDKDLDDLVHVNRQNIEIDIDKEYEQKVKVLYNAILEFISKAQSSLPPEHANRLFELRQTTTDIVMNIKNVKHLRKNLVHYNTTSAAAIRDEYDGLRIEIAQMLRDVHALRFTKDDERDILSLDATKASLIDRMLEVNLRIDALINENKIEPAMGTSFINDMSYVRDMIWKLEGISMVLYGSRDIEMKEAESLLKLDDEELAALADKAAD